MPSWVLCTYRVKWSTNQQQVSERLNCLLSADESQVASRKASAWLTQLNSEGVDVGVRGCKQIPTSRRNKLLPSSKLCDLPFLLICAKWRVHRTFLDFMTLTLFARLVKNSSSVIEPESFLPWKCLSSGILCRVVSSRLAHVSEMLPASMTILLPRPRYSTTS
jgi:hypothetical protein